MSQQPQPARNQCLYSSEHCCSLAGAGCQAGTCWELWDGKQCGLSGITQARQQPKDESFPSLLCQAQAWQWLPQSWGCCQGQGTVVLHECT